MTIHVDYILGEDKPYLITPLGSRLPDHMLHSPVLQRGETRRRRRARRGHRVTTLQLGFLPRLSRDCDIVLVFAAAVSDCLAYHGGRVRTGGNTPHHKPDDSH